MYSRIVVGTDGTDRALIAVDHAAGLAAVCSAELHVVAAGAFTDAVARTAARIGRDAVRRHGVRVIEHPRVGDAVSVLIAVADSVDADLIVVASKPSSAQVRRMAGALATKLAHHCARPLLIVHTG